MDAVEDAINVNASGPIPIVVGRLCQSGDEPDRSIVDEDMDLSKSLSHLPGGGGHACAIGDVHADGVDAVLEAREEAHRAVAMCGGAVGEGDLHAGVDESAHDAEA